MNGGSTGRGVANRYAELTLDGDAVIVYDRTRTQAWIQSDVTVPTDGAADSDAERERRLAAAHAERPVDRGDID